MRRKKLEKTKYLFRQVKVTNKKKRRKTKNSNNSSKSFGPTQWEWRDRERRRKRKRGRGRRRGRDIVENPSCVILSPPPFAVYRERCKIEDVALNTFPFLYG
jgi:hypothetical protein